MSAQYREGSKPTPPSYQIGKQKMDTCQGQFTCNFGKRSAYDVMQFQHYVKGAKEPIQTVKNIPGWN